MSIFIFILGLLQALFIRFLGQVGTGLVNRAMKEHEQCRYEPKDGWPACALIVPVAGSHANMSAALTSLLDQNYPCYKVCLVVADEQDKAFPLASSLAAMFDNAQVTLAGQAVDCGQKNYNLLAGIACADPETEVYAFADSTHLAQPDFLRCLVGPIARKEAAFSTGYHQIQPQDTGMATLAYTLCVLFMRFLQGISGFTQLWGGAMAMSRKAFESYDVENLWRSNVVDDCSLSGYLMRKGVHARLCPAALLLTPSKACQFSTWRSWLERQILFLKFCVKSQWIGLGLFCFIMLLPPLWAALSILRGLAGSGGGLAPFLALFWLCVLAFALLGWRKFVAISMPISRWLCAFFCAVFMFALVYCNTLFSKHILWHNVRYDVGKDGIVLKMRREDSGN